VGFAPIDYIYGQVASLGESPALLIVGNKMFGISGNLRICAPQCSPASLLFSLRLEANGPLEPSFRGPPETKRTLPSLISRFPMVGTARRMAAATLGVPCEERRFLPCDSRRLSGNNAYLTLTYLLNYLEVVLGLMLPIEEAEKVDKSR
jgi:hypothetical protein